VVDKRSDLLMFHFFLLALSALLASCGGSDPPTAPQSFSVGGTVSGLTTTGLKLANGADLVEIFPNATTFAFPGAIPSGSSYDATVQSQPGTRDEHCALSANKGVVATSNVNSVAVTCHPTQWAVTRLAGAGTIGATDGPGTSATFTYPDSLAVDAGGTIYVMDTGGFKVRKITASGLVSTLAGSGTSGSSDGVGTAASFAVSFGIAVDADGNVYVADWGNNKIRKITPTGQVTTFAGSGLTGSTDGPAATASFDGPRGVAVDKVGSVYVADTFNHKIRKISPTGVVTTIAGSGAAGSADAIGSAASFNFPKGLALDDFGNLYVADLNNFKIRKITPEGIVTTLAGTGIDGTADGPGNAATFGPPTAVTVDGYGNVYVADGSKYKVRKVTAAGFVTTIAGTGLNGSNDGVGTSASFEGPNGIAVDIRGTIYLAETLGHRVREITPE
jgi:sugar lactone lactonase YvrE